ncbi:hypothetical protein L596_019344 [Steinernema carpocapsae]|uniref:C-type lectin domain-containing protein n=1 Tax=Steinernema carpocapsae TaxID=34508 RepID=A0A4V6A0I9_STECR|nr:hypothetical protein L596_019344 [Steinernema carpocapsae]
MKLFLLFVSISAHLIVSEVAAIKKKATCDHHLGSVVSSHSRNCYIFVVIPVFELNALTVCTKMGGNLAFFKNADNVKGLFLRLGTLFGDPIPNY